MCALLEAPGGEGEEEQDPQGARVGHSLMVTERTRPREGP